MNGVIRVCWTIVSGRRLTVICLGVLVAALVASQAVVALDIVRNPMIPPAVASWLLTAGLDDVARAPWFVSVLGTLVLNLACGLIAEWVSESAEGSNSDAGGDRLLSESETRLGKEAFVELARAWCRRRLKRTANVETTASEAFLEVRRGRASRHFDRAARFSFLCAICGAAWLFSQGFQARGIVGEGSRTHALELTRGQAPSSWSPYLLDGKILPGYVDPGFEIERVDWDHHQALLRFFDRGTGSLVGSAEVSALHPASFRGLAIHLVGEAHDTASSADVVMTERKGGEARKFEGLAIGRDVVLRDDEGRNERFRVLEIQPESDINGPAVELEFRSGAAPAQRFWIFRDFPNYDFVHRRKSPEHFDLVAVHGLRAAELRVGREPGAWLLWGGLLFGALLTWAAGRQPEEKFWLHWTAAQEHRDGASAPNRVEFLGWGERRILFEPRFYRVAGLFEDRLEAAGAADAARQSHGRS